jgi:hypothetical protein
MTLLLCGCTVLLFSLALAPAARPENSVTWTGWFSDEKCASARAAAGTFTATNPDCARACIEKGSAAVFISEQAKAIFLVKDYSSVLQDLGYHIEIQATVDDAGKTISIWNVKRLAYQGAACERRKGSSEK